LRAGAFPLVADGVSAVHSLRCTARKVIYISSSDNTIISGQLQETNSAIIGEISGSQGDEYEDDCLLGCSTV
jgi:hypothetical protein